LPLWHTIPGETPIEDISGLKIKGISTREELNLYEARNVLKAVEKYLLGGRLTDKTAPFDFTWALRLHREMFGDVWKWAGEIRKNVTNIGVQPSQIEPKLYDLLLRLPYWKDMPLITQAVMLHHGAVFIHPFENGNGRWSRMLANIWTFREGGVPVRWPDELLGADSPARQDYLKAIKASDEGEYEPLIELHKKYTPPDDQQAP
jgi:Fic-DOC domain mobile mystery protein B